MAEVDYVPFVDRMINRYEGGYGWDRNDPGGPTKYGITCYDLAQFLHQFMNSMGAWAPKVQAMTLDTADQIYATKYATACAFNALNVGKDCVVFDTGVNSGSSRSIKIGQKVVGFTGDDVDGILGDKTLAAFNAFDPQAFVIGHCAARLVFLRGLSTWDSFGTGWTNRVNDLRTYSLGLIQHPAQRMASGFVDKPHRIDMAFAKAYAPEDMAEVAPTH